MDRSNEKHAGSGYLTQVSVGWEPRFNFNPLKSPPNFSILGIFRSFLREIDKLSPSDLKSIGYRLLVDEFCAFVEDADLEVKLGLESKLVNLIEHGFQEIGSNQKASNDTSSVMLNGLGNPSLSDTSLMPEMTKPTIVGYASQCTSDPEAREGSVFRALSPCLSEPSHHQDVSRETSYRCKACEKRGYHRGPPALHLVRCSHPQKRPHIPETPEVPRKRYQYGVQPQDSGKLKLVGNWEAISNMPDSPELNTKNIPQGQPYSTGFPEIQTFRGLFNPMVIRYPQPGQVPREQSPFSTIDSAARQLSFKSNWNGLSFASAKEIWTLGICSKEWLIDIAKNIPNAKVHPDSSENIPWPLYSCPKEFFVDILRKIYIKTTDIEPAWAQSEEEMDQFLSTCTTFHTLETIKDSEGIYAPALDRYDRLYCMYAMQSEYSSETMNLRHFMRQIVVLDEQTNIISGKKVIITPTLWDPHKPYDALREQTRFSMTPPYLTWDVDIYSFVGAINIAKRSCPSMVVDCVIQAYTIEDLPKGARFETTVEASVNLHIRIPETEKWKPRPESLGAEGAEDLWEPSVGSDPGSIGNLDDDIYTVKKVDTVNIDVPMKKYIPSTVSATPPDTIGVYGGTHPTFKQRKIAHEKEGVISLRWDPEQWLSVIVRVESPRKKLGWKSESDGVGLFDPVDGSRHISQNRPTDPGLDETSRHDSHKAATMFVRANAEQVEYEGYNLTLGLEIELVLTKGGESAGAQVFDEVTTFIEQLPSTKVQLVEARKPDSFGSIIFGADAHMKDRMLGLRGDRGKVGIPVDLGMGIEKLRCIQWRKVMLPKILKSLGKFSGRFRCAFTASVHIGKRGGYTLQEVKRIAKTFMIYGDLLDYTKFMRDESPTRVLSPDFGSSRHNSYSKNFSASQNINSIDMAVSLSDVIAITNPKMHRTEDYRFDFSKLKTQGTIVLTQKIPISCTELTTKWIAGVLAAITAAMKIEDSDFNVLAKAPSSWKNFELLLSNDKEGIGKLSLRKAMVQERSEEGFMPFEDNSSEIWRKMVDSRAAKSTGGM